MGGTGHNERQSGHANAGLYPVIASVSRPPKHVWRRNGALVPRWADYPGSTMVAQLDDRFEPVVAGRRWDDPSLATASHFVVVSLREHLIRTSVWFPSAEAADGVRITAGFRCRVFDPVLTLESGCWDARVPLAAYLAGMARLRMACLSGSAGNWYATKAKLSALLIAHCEVIRVQVPGMMATFAGAELELAAAPPPGPDPAAGPQPPDGAAGSSFSPTNYTWEEYP